MRHKTIIANLNIASYLALLLVNFVVFPLDVVVTLFEGHFQFLALLRRPVEVGLQLQTVETRGRLQRTVAGVVATEKSNEMMFNQ